jgi:Ca2+-binding RTX toxin-like protein
MSENYILNFDDDILAEVTILDSNNNNNFVGTPEDDKIVGGTLDDTINGGEKDDLILGGGGNNLLVGDEGDDTLTGAGIDINSISRNKLVISLNRPGIDTLTGGTGEDTFILGGNPDSIEDVNGSPVFLYDRAGNEDYALITDFDSNEDKIILGGSKNDYVLGSSPSGLPEGTGIFRQEELVAIVQGNSQLNLNDSYFET